MPEIRHRQTSASPEIEYGEIHIPDNKRMGTGSFTTEVKPGALSVGKAVSSIMVNAPAFQISLNLNPLTGEIPVLLGFADGSDPISKKVFFFPKTINLSTSHEFKVTFENWEIRELIMDGLSLDLKESFGMGISQEGLLPPGSPIPEHEGSLVITLPSHRLPKDLQEKILDEIFDLGQYFTFYQVNQDDTQIYIYRNTDFQFVYRHYNPTFGEREITIDFADAERQGARAFYLAATWSPSKNSFYVGLIHTDPKFEPLRSAFALSQDKLRLIKENIETLEEIMNTPGKEEETHQFLKNNSIIIGLTSEIDPISKFKLGDDYVTDFVIKEKPDGYILIEIERPNKKLFKKPAPPKRTQDFNHAIEQLENWRAWVGQNHSYISSKLESISPSPTCWLIVGRRVNLSPEERKRLEEINQEYKGSYKILTYDDLVDRVRSVINRLV